MRAKLYWREKFILPSPIPNPTPSLAIGFARNLEHPGVQPCNHYWNPNVNPTFNVQNGFFHFSGHESTQSGERDFGLLTLHLIKREDERVIISIIISIESNNFMIYFLLLINVIQMNKITMAKNGIQPTKQFLENLIISLESFNICVIRTWRILKSTEIMDEEIKNQVINSARDTYLKDLNNKCTGFLGIPCHDLLGHLLYWYGKLTTADLEASNQKINEQINLYLLLAI